MPNLRIVLFVLFVASGFCSLVYQVVWLRLAFAAFGIITPVLSVVLSVFMLGLAVGSWLAGRFIESFSARTGISPAFAYGVAELGIGAGAFVVPVVFHWGQRALLGAGEASSFRFLLLSAVIIMLAILLFTTLMGMTFPLMMAFIRGLGRSDTGSFSYLYLANVIGAMAGASITALVLIEVLGFRRTLLLTAFLNLLVALTAFRLPGLARRTQLDDQAVQPETAPVEPSGPEGGLSRRMVLTLLFSTGFASLAMEVVWTRAFTPILRTTIYAFAAVLSVYLFATWLGSAVYRYQRLRGRVFRTEQLLGALFTASLLPLVLNDPRWHADPLITLLSIVPFSGVLGYLTPRLIDMHSSGEPRSAGQAYAVNILGCITGPLIAGYLLLPFLGVKGSLILLTLVYAPFLAVRFQRTASATAYAGPAIGLGVLLVGIIYSSTYEDPALYPRPSELRRDHTATVLSLGEGMEKRLYVNGISITYLTPITKFMAHLPLVMRPEPPKSTLVICFGMGTTFRSLASWEGRTTAVELVPSVRDAFGFYFSDAAAILAQPGRQIVVDDGRRFLSRTDEKFDLITLDPPPPPEAAGSSLLYSVEFSRLLKERLSPGGIVQQWFPGGEPVIGRAVYNSVRSVFPYVKTFRSIQLAGAHFIASDKPLETPTVEEAIARMPPAALRDLMEWYPDRDPKEVWREMFGKEADFSKAKETPLLTDDRPFNEYFWLRRTLEEAHAELLQTK